MNYIINIYSYKLKRCFVEVQEMYTNILVPKENNMTFN